MVNAKEHHHPVHHRSHRPLRHPHFRPNRTKTKWTYQVRAVLKDDDFLQYEWSEFISGFMLWSELQIHTNTQTKDKPLLWLITSGLNKFGLFDDGTSRWLMVVVDCWLLIVVANVVSAFVTAGTAVATVRRLPAKPPPPAWLDEMTLIELLLSPLPPPTLPVPVPVPIPIPIPVPLPVPAVVESGRLEIWAKAIDEVVGVIGI